MFRETECRESIPRLSKEDGGGPYARVPRNLKDHARDRSDDPQSLSKEERDQGRVCAPECGRKFHKSSKRHNQGHGWCMKGRERGPSFVFLRNEHNGWGQLQGSRFDYSRITYLSYLRFRFRPCRKAFPKGHRSHGLCSGLS